MPTIDPIKSIEKMHQEGLHKVPYPVFLNCFNKLMEDPIRGKPAKPTDELEPFFRAACMALDMGVADSLGRAEDRQKEFFGRVLPLWKEALPQAKFQPYQDILNATIRKRLDKERREKEKGEAEERQKQREQESAAAAEQELHTEFAKLSKAALKEPGIEVEEKKQGTAATKPAAPASTPAQAAATPAAEAAPAATPIVVAPQRPAPQTTQELEAVLHAIREGRMPIQYSDLQSKRPLVCYAHEGRRFLVYLVKSANSHYLTVTFAEGLAGRPEAERNVINALGARGFTEVDPLIYEKQGDSSTLQVKLSRQSTGIALKQEAAFTQQTLAQTMRDMHDVMTAVLHALEGGGGDKA